MATTLRENELSNGLYIDPTPVLAKPGRLVC